MGQLPGVTLPGGAASALLLSAGGPWPPLYPCWGSPNGSSLCCVPPPPPQTVIWSAGAKDGVHHTPKGADMRWGPSRTGLAAVHEARESDGPYHFPSQMESCYSCMQVVINHGSLWQPTAHLGTISLPPAAMQWEHPKGTAPTHLWSPGGQYPPCPQHRGEGMATWPGGQGGGLEERAAGTEAQPHSNGNCRAAASCRGAAAPIPHPFTLPSLGPQRAINAA